MRPLWKVLCLKVTQKDPLWMCQNSNLRWRVSSTKLFSLATFDIWKFSLKERFGRQRQRKVDDMLISFTFIATCFYCFCPLYLTINVNIDISKRPHWTVTQSERWKWMSHRGLNSDSPFQRICVINLPRLPNLIVFIHNYYYFRNVSQSMDWIKKNRLFERKLFFLFEAT